MNIIYKDYKLTPGMGNDTWDLYVKKYPKVTEKNKDKYPNKKIGELTGDSSWSNSPLGYDFRLDKACHVIVHQTLAKIDKDASFSEFLAVWLKEKEDLKKAIKGVIG